MSRDLLIELGTEELPPKALRRLSEAFRDGVWRGFGDAGLDHGAIHAFATPRRLALLIGDLTEAQPDQTTERRGPALSAAFDDEGLPTKAAQGFARSCGMEVSDLETLETAKGSWLVHRSLERGRSTGELIPGIVTRALEALPIPKRMRWGALEVQFVRPVHWLVLLFGDQVIDAEILGARAGRETRGHRFHHPEPIYLGEPAAYAPLLETEGRVLADFDQRREAIRGQVLEAAVHAGGSAIIADELLDEVTAMVEWPVAILGRFEARFLEVPAEALVAAMKGHQKYFHVVDGQGALLPHFITVSNIDSRDPEVVRAGNERVIRPRLADAAFFWDQDRKQPLAGRLERLRDVVFETRLGTLYDKVQRTIHLAGFIAESLGFDRFAAERAAELCKCDLVTDMVGEFPELQGTMGRYYAAADGERPEVAAAVEEHYLPRFAGDRLPGAAAGQALALADKLDTLVGIFGIGQPPTGDRDPYALRRAALGVLRIAIELDLPVDVPQALNRAAEGYTQQGKQVIAPGTAEAVYEFILGRLQQYYSARGVSADAIEAVACLRPALNDLDRRLQALNEFRALPAAESLSAANKRISNILKKTDEPIPERPDPALLQAPAERRLHKELESVRARVEPMLAERRYGDGMAHLAELREAVDEFFDTVMVMDDDDALRGNRLALLASLRGLFLTIADVSRLQ